MQEHITKSLGCWALVFVFKTARVKTKHGATLWESSMVFGIQCAEAYPRDWLIRGRVRVLQGTLVAQACWNDWSQVMRHWFGFIAGAHEENSLKAATRHTRHTRPYLPRATSKLSKIRHSPHSPHLPW